MTQTNIETTDTIHKTPLVKLMLIGAVIGAAVIAFFVFQVEHPRYEWGPYWMVRPLIVVPLAGAMGGICYYILDFLRCHGGWKKVVANVLSALIFIVGIWMGIVLGLVGTLWH